MGAALEVAMIPISRRKQIVGVAVVVACSYAISWVCTPGPGTGPTESFGQTFDRPAAPAVIQPQAPALSRDKRVITSEPLNSSPKPLQANRYEPI
jgi:hypothetical protein